MTKSCHLLAMELKKVRTDYTINGCIAEMAVVTAGGKTIRTTAIEAEDPDHVITMVSDLGLSRFPNINYLRGQNTMINIVV